MLAAANRLRLGGKHALLHKGKRVRKARLITNKYQASGPPDGEGWLRAPYFKYYRAERTALAVMENTYITTNFNRRQYRACRYLYYAVIPHLAKYLWFEPDRVRLQEVEHDFYNLLLSYRFKSGRYEEPNRVLIWSFRHPRTAECGPQLKL